jgi:hypothetical protein
LRDFAYRYWQVPDMNTKDLNINKDRESNEKHEIIMIVDKKTYDLTGYVAYRDLNQLIIPEALRKYRLFEKLFQASQPRYSSLQVMLYGGRMHWLAYLIALNAKGYRNVNVAYKQFIRILTRVSPGEEQCGGSHNDYFVVCSPYFRELKVTMQSLMVGFDPRIREMNDIIWNYTDPGKVRKDQEGVFFLKSMHSVPIFVTADCAPQDKLEEWENIIRGGLEQSSLRFNDADMSDIFKKDSAQAKDDYETDLQIYKNAISDRIPELEMISVRNPQAYIEELIERNAKKQFEDFKKGMDVSARALSFIAKTLTLSDWKRETYEYSKEALSLFARVNVGALKFGATTAFGASKLAFRAARGTTRFAYGATKGVVRTFVPGARLVI